MSSSVLLLPLLLLVQILLLHQFVEGMDWKMQSTNDEAKASRSGRTNRGNSFLSAPNAAQLDGDGLGRGAQPQQHYHQQQPQPQPYHQQQTQQGDQPQQHQPQRLKDIVRHVALLNQQVRQFHSHQATKNAIAVTHQRSQDKSESSAQTVPTNSTELYEPINLAPNQEQDYLVQSDFIGASSKNPILIADEKVDEHRQMKRPAAEVEEGRVMGSAGGQSAQQLKGKQIKVDEAKGTVAPPAAEGDGHLTAAAEEDENLKLLLQTKKNFLKKIWEIFDACVNTLGIKVNSEEQPMPFDDKSGVKWPELNLVLEKMDLDKVMSNILTKLFNNEELTKWLLFIKMTSQINSEAKVVFGREIFVTTKGRPEKRVFNWIRLPNEVMEGKKLKILYVLMRLIRKLLGLLETPYILDRPESTVAEQSKRKCMVNWMSTALAQMSEKFDATVASPSIKEASKMQIELLKSLRMETKLSKQQVVGGMKLLEEGEFANELLRLALFCTSQTLAPLEDDAHFLALTNPTDDFFIKFAKIVEENNFMCVMLSKERRIDFMQIIQRSIYWQFSYGVAAIFADLILNALEQYKIMHGTGGSGGVKKQSAIVYLNIYGVLLDELSRPELEVLVKHNVSTYQKWTALKAFLDQIVRQLRTFVAQWESAKRQAQIEGAKVFNEIGFVSDYLLENCIQLIASSSNSSENGGGGKMQQRRQQ